MAAPKKKLPIKSIAKAYGKGKTLAELGREHDSDPRTIRSALVDAGVTLRG